MPYIVIDDYVIFRELMASLITGNMVVKQGFLMTQTMWELPIPFEG